MAEADDKLVLGWTLFLSKSSVLVLRRVGNSTCMVLGDVGGLEILKKYLVSIFQLQMNSQGKYRSLSSTYISELAKKEFKINIIEEEESFLLAQNSV